MHRRLKTISVFLCMFTPGCVWNLPASSHETMSPAGLGIAPNPLTERKYAACQTELRSARQESNTLGNASIGLAISTAVVAGTTATIGAVTAKEQTAAGSMNVEKGSISPLEGTVIGLSALTAIIPGIASILTVLQTKKQARADELKKMIERLGPMSKDTPRDDELLDLCGYVSSTTPTSEKSGTPVAKANE